MNLILETIPILSCSMGFIIFHRGNNLTVESGAIETREEKTSIREEKGGRSKAGGEAVVVAASRGRGINKRIGPLQEIYAWNKERGRWNGGENRRKSTACLCRGNNASITYASPTSDSHSWCGGHWISPPNRPLLLLPLFRSPFISTLFHESFHEFKKGNLLISFLTIIHILDQFVSLRMQNIVEYLGEFSFRIFKFEGLILITKIITQSLRQWYNWSENIKDQERVDWRNDKNVNKIKTLSLG